MTLRAGAGDLTDLPDDLEVAAREFDPNTRNTDGRLWERTAELRRTCPVSVSEQMDGFTAVVDHGLVTEAMRDWRTFSSAEGALLRQAARDFRLYPFELDPPLHTSIKGCLSPLFTRARVRALEPDIREIVSALIDAFADRGACEFMSEFAFPLSGQVVIDAGDVVYLVVQGANVDPNAFDDPDEVDLDRRTRGAPAHLSFGAGIHQCLGRNVARLEVKVAIEEVFARLPGLRLADEHVVFGQGQNWGPTALQLTWATP